MSTVAWVLVGTWLYVAASCWLCCRIGRMSDDYPETREW